VAGMKAYSLDLRQKILRAYDQRRGSQRALAALFEVSQSSLISGLAGDHGRRSLPCPR
jgi:transposase